MSAITEEDEHIATLVHADEYAKNVGQVASISTHRILYVKRRELAMTPYELLEFPTSSCTSVTYQKKLALVPMIVGVLLVGLVTFILTSEVAPGTRVPVGALAILVVVGATLFAGPKRHQFTFMVDGKRLKWRSRAGDYKYKVASVRKVLAWAESKGLTNGTRTEI